MKKLFLISFVMVATVFIAACSGPKHDEAAASEEWPAMDKFHMTVAEAYHPYKDSSDLKSAKVLADTLVMEANAWADAPRPDKVNTKEVTDALDALKSACAEFAQSVKNNESDDVLGRELTSLHEKFHGIMELYHHERKEEHSH